MREMVCYLLKPVLDSRARRISCRIAAALEEGDSVVDIGCGDLRVGREVTKRVKVTWTGVDTLDYNTTNLPYRQCDGKTLPFPDDHFNVALLSFVLHHCEDPISLLRESLRVTRKRLIVMEDVPRGSWEFPLARWHDFLANKIIEPRISLPYGFKSLPEWLDIFKKQDVEVRKAESFKTQPLAFVNQVMFVLEKVHTEPASHLKSSGIFLQAV